MKRSWLIITLICTVGAAAAAMILMYSLPLDFRERSPVQPLGFSHKLHVGTNGIPCLYCHRSAANSRIAGLPSLADCRDCHLYISTDSPQIKKLIEYWDSRVVVPWVRVNSIPDHVYFPHMMHLRARIDCSACHGPVSNMERTTRTVSLKMGWCLDCHRKHKASIDCWTCHI